MSSRIALAITVNGQMHRVSVDSETTLLEFLRKELGLTGAKNGCDGKGICGACTVIVNGRAVKSCLLRMGELEGAEVTTIEGLASNGLHPLQAAFVKAGAIQCGFCTPGMIMAAKALLDVNPNPSEKEIARALQGNLCRCTGYVKIIQAVKEAATAIREGRAIPLTSHQDSHLIGEPLPPKAAVEKAAGRFLFLDDLPSTDALIAKVVWASHAHARIRRIDISKAETVPGVVKVLTARDVPGQNAYGLIQEDQPVLCSDRVRYRGDPVALVIAKSAQAAEKGAALVKVEYEPLPAVFEPEAALDPSAPALFPEGNVACKFALKRGDPETTFSRAALVVEGTFSTQAVEHAYLEPESGIAEWKDDRLIVRSACQYPQAVRRQLAKVLGNPEEMIRVISHPTGGAFGGKTDISVHALLALAAWHTKRKVKLTLSRAESLRASVKRHPMRLTYRIGLDENGHILAIKGKIVANCGAYQTLSIPLLEQTTAFSTGPYRVPHVDIEVVGVFTNTPPSSAMRGFGIPQPAFAVESLLDEAARKLGLSPIEIRRRNALRPGDESPTGQRMGPDTHLLETLDALEEEYQRFKTQELGADIGVGIACGYKNIGLGLGEEDYAEAQIEILPTGRVCLRVGAVDLGQGAATVLAQIAAHELGIAYELVDVEWGDTDTTPDARETNASRQTVVSGNAVVEAAHALRRLTLEKVKRWHIGFEPPLSYQNGAVVDRAGHWISVFELAKEEGLSATGRYLAPKTMPLCWDILSDEEYRNYFTYSFFSNLALVKVDRATGRAQVIKIVSAYDVGRALNRLTLEGQLEGGAVMGMGYALSEEYIAHGESMTDNLAKCGLPRALATPEVVSRLIETGDSVGPYGAKGVGEVAMIAVAPAITNAIYDAVGIRVRSLPVKPSKLKRALLSGKDEVR